MVRILRHHKSAFKVLVLLQLLLSYVTSDEETYLKGCRCNDVTFIVNCNDAGFSILPREMPSYARTITLSGNKLQKIGPRIFTDGLRLADFDLSSNAVDEVADDAFFNVKHTLTKLNLRGNRLTKIPEPALSRLPLLNELSLANNELETLSTRSFQKLISLRKLDLSGNWLNQISLNAFYGLQSLLYLDLSSNNLGALTPVTLRSLNSLVKLNLSRSSLKTLHPSSLSHVSFLEELNLSQNDIDEIKVGTFVELRRLKVLDISTNQLTNIEDGKFFGLKRLQKLNLRGNKIKKIFDGALKDMKNLQTLDLSENRLYSVPTRAAWDGLVNLRAIYLAQNQISAISSGTFWNGLDVSNGIQNVIELDLSSNNISVISPGAFNPVMSLKRLSLAHNRLTVISGDTFIGNVNLKELYLGFNSLRTPNFSWFRTAMHPGLARDLRLSNFLVGNPWTCDCALYYQAKGFLEQYHATFKNSTEADDLSCVEPTYVKGRSFSWFIHTEKSHCEIFFIRFFEIMGVLVAFSIIVTFFLTAQPLLSKMRNISNGPPNRKRLDSYKRDKIL